MNIHQIFRDMDEPLLLSKGYCYYGYQLLWFLWQYIFYAVTLYGITASHIILLLEDFSMNMHPRGRSRTSPRRGTNP